MPATFSTALPAIATTTMPAKACEMCSISIAGSSALTNHSDTSAAPSDATTSTVMASHSGQAPCVDGAFSACRTVRSGSELSEKGRLKKNTMSSSIAHAAPSAFSCSAAGVCNSAASVGIDERRDGEHHQRRDHARRLGVEMQAPVFETTDENRDAQHEQRVREDRSDERRLNDLQQTGAQGERADEHLGKIAERRLQHAGGPGTEMFADLLRATRHVHREQRQRDRGGDELDDGAGAAELRDGRGDDCRGRDAEDDAIVTCQHSGWARSEWATRVGGFQARRRMRVQATGVQSTRRVSRRA